MDKKKTVFLTDVLEVAPAEKVSDGVYKLKAVGSVTNVVYKSGRVIPFEVQQKAMTDAVGSTKQMTAYLDHPLNIRGKLEDLAAIHTKYHFDDETGRTILDEIRVLDTKKGKELRALLDANVKVGVSQRAEGFESVKKWDNRVVMLVDTITEIHGWDFCLLDNANAGDVTKVEVITDSILDEIRKSPIYDEQEQEDIPMPKTDQAAPPVNGDGKEAVITDEKPQDTSGALDAIVESNQKLTASIEKMIGAIEDSLKAALKREEADQKTPEKVWDVLRLARQEIGKITDDKEMTPENKNSKLAKIGEELKSLLSQVAEDYVDAHMVEDTVDAPKEDAPAAAPAKEGKPEDKTAEVVTLSDDLSSALSEMANAMNKATKSSRLQSFLTDSVKALEIGDSNRKQIIDTLSKRQFANEAEVTAAIEDAVGFLNAGVANERLKNQGLKPEGVADMNLQVTRDEYLNGVHQLTDSLIGQGGYRANGAGVDKIVTPDDPQVKALLSIFDTRFGAALKEEARQLLDATTTVDFQTPVTISRIILEEVYANYIVPQITDFGSMDNDRDSIPITRWRRETGSSSTYKPTKLQIAQTKVGELAAINMGKLVTEWYPLDAEARKLAARLSEEFITRAKRKANITGVAKALQNLVDDIRRIIQQEVFLDMLEAAMEYGATAINFSDTGDGTTSEFTVTSGGSISMGTDLTVTVNSEACGLYGYDSSTANSQGLYYLPSYAYGTVLFVDSSGDPLAPTNTHTISITGKEVTNESRFNLGGAGSTEWSIYMNGLLFAVQNAAASHAQNRGYEPDMLLSSLVTGQYVQQAKAYERLGERPGFTGAAKLKEGNMGITAGFPHWGSKVFPDEFILITEATATIFRQYEPLHLYGPVEARDGDGALIGGKEYYGYQEDALTTPIGDKLSLITVYNT